MNSRRQRAMRPTGRYSKHLTIALLCTIRRAWTYSLSRVEFLYTPLQRAMYWRRYLLKEGGEQFCTAQAVPVTEVHHKQNTRTFCFACAAACFAYTTDLLLSNRLESKQELECVSN